MTQTLTDVSPPSRIVQLTKKPLRTILYLATSITVWFTYVRVADVPAFLLPSPEFVFFSLNSLHSTGQLWGNLFYTLNHILLGFISGVILGVSIGYLLNQFPLLQKAATPYIVILQAAPKIAIAPLLVLWFGLGPASQLTLIFILTFFPMMVAMQLGLNSVPNELRTLGDLFSMGRVRYFRTIQLPAALPDLFSGAKVAIIDAMTGAFLAEYISAQQGLGFLMVLGNQSFNAPMLIAAILVTVAVGLIGFALVSSAERKLLGWQSAVAGRNNK